MYNTQRDIFISELHQIARKDPNVIMISVDMGAPSLDAWREELPEQFFAGGISEQNSINFAAGLAAEGKKVYVYAMSCWAARCLEQLRYSCAMARLPITFLGNGVGLGYAPAGPAHCATDDIGYLRTINGIEIISPANLHIIKPLVELSYNRPRLRVFRLERTMAPEVKDCYPQSEEKDVSLGYSLLYSSRPRPFANSIAIASSGYMLGRAMRVASLLSSTYDVSVVDVFKIKPLNPLCIHRIAVMHDYFVTIEEQTLCGGFGSALAEAIIDANFPHKIPILRLGLPPRYIFENGNREQLLDNNRLSVDDIHQNILKFVK